MRTEVFHNQLKTLKLFRNQHQLEKISKIIIESRVLEGLRSIRSKELRVCGPKSFCRKALQIGILIRVVALCRTCETLNRCLGKHRMSRKCRHLVDHSRPHALESGSGAKERTCKLCTLHQLRFEQSMLSTQNSFKVNNNINVKTTHTHKAQVPAGILALLASTLSS